MGDRLVEALRVELAKHCSVKAAWLFGSRATGDARPDSDVDIGVLLEAAPRTLSEIPDALAAALEAVVDCPVDVVVLNGAPVDLVRRVLVEGMLLVEHDPSARVAFEVQKQNEYWDLEPMMRLTRGLPPGARP